METPCYNTVDRVPLMDINMAVGNQHSHLLSILAKKKGQFMTQGNHKQ